MKRLFLMSIVTAATNACRPDRDGRLRIALYHMRRLWLGLGSGAPRPWLPELDQPSRSGRQAWSAAVTIDIREQSLHRETPSIAGDRHRQIRRTPSDHPVKSPFCRSHGWIHSWP